MGEVLGVDALGGHDAEARGDGGGRDAAEENRRVVRGAAELVARLVGAVAPTVIRELVQELQGGAVRLESIGAHRKLLVDAADGAVEPGVADATIEPVVVTVVQVVGLRVSVADAPALEDRLAHVGFAVAVGVLEKQEPRRLGHDHPAVHEHEARRKIEVVREHRKLVGLAVAVGVLADLDRVIAGAARGHAVRIVAGLADPEPAALVPRHGDRLGNVGFGREQFEPQVGRELGAFDAALHRERLLKSDGWGAPLVVRDVRIGLAAFRLALRDERFPSRAAVGARRGQDPFAQGARETRGGPGRLFRGQVARDQLLRFDSGQRRVTVCGRVEQHHVEARQPFAGGHRGIGRVVEPDRLAS